MQTWDVAVIGAGAVGVAVARELTLRGLSVLILEKNPDVLSEASSGNTGHLARNFYYTKERAPLEFAMTRRAAETSAAWLAQQPNVPRRRTGLIMLAFDAADLRYLQELKSLGAANGEVVDIISPAEVERREPGLCIEGVVGALYSPDEYVVDSFLLALSNLYVALHHGCTLRTSAPVHSATRRDGLWLLLLERNELLRARCVVNCAGNFSSEVDAILRNGLGQTSAAQPSFTIRPAKGEFLVLTSPVAPNPVGPQSMVLVVPKPTYAGPYVYPSAYGHVVVGPTHAPQDSKSDRSCDPARMEALRAHLVRLFPHMAEAPILGSFSGLRPACVESADYQIHIDSQSRWATIGAIRSTGLTASRALAEHIANELFPGPQQRGDVPMPPPKFFSDGTVAVGSLRFRVMHPLTQLGIASEFKSKL
eukprot:TRINITY_DN7212_c0_g1_i1.p1 TRINITY_DN7212_c0_g1~~TRINITY_DN7212_c0_g1_i1.p1  ORF type:complete len:422 (+),score=50.64 TRINITY_DN7212_c0_g1_i1:140-1405(+)